MVFDLTKQRCITSATLATRYRPCGSALSVSLVRESHNSFLDGRGQVWSLQVEVTTSRRGTTVNARSTLEAGSIIIINFEVFSWKKESINTHVPHSPNVGPSVSEEEYDHIIMMDGEL